MPPTGSPGDELKESSVQRYQRVIGFAANFARARRREFDLLWRERGKHGPKAEEFVRRVDGLLAMVEKGQRLLEQARGMSAQQATMLLAGFNLDHLNVATRGLDKVARELKADPALQAAVTGALTSMPRTRELPSFGTSELGKETRRLMGMVKGWLAPTAPVVPAAPPKPASPPKPATAAPAPPPPPPAPVKAAPALPLDQQHQAFNAAVELVNNVLEKVGPRLKIVSVSLEATGLPARKRPWEDVERDLPELAPEAGLQPAQVGWALMVAESFYRESRAVQVAHMALTQWRQARMLLVEARELQDQIARSSESARPLLLGRFHVGKFKATVFPLSHLHLTFKGLSPLQDLFPPP